MRQKLFVLSMDAMVYEDIAYLETKPNFQKLFKKRAQVEKVRSVYPTSTYPAHSTLMTGCNPDKHGVYANFPICTWQDDIAHWPLYYTSVYAQDIFAAAKKAGMTTAAVYWPITGCNPNIDHIINEYFFYYDDLEDWENTFARQGADAVALQAARENTHLLPTNRNEKTLTPFSQFDPFLMGCACSLIRNAKPDLLMVHNSYIDTARHRFGTFAPEIRECLDWTDQWLGDVIQAMEDAGVYEQTNFVLLSDHGQMDYHITVNINALFRQDGWIQVSPDGKLYDWHAYAQSNGKSTTVHLRDNTNQKLFDRAHDYLLQLQRNPENGIEKVYTLEDVQKRYNVSGPFSFLLEATEDVAFGSSFAGDVYCQKPVHGTHGYMPEKGPQPVFLASGPAFRDAVLKSAKLTDIAPTLAATFGQTFEDADGQALTELLV